MIISCFKSFVKGYLVLVKNLIKALQEYDPNAEVQVLKKVPFKNKEGRDKLTLDFESLKIIERVKIPKELREELRMANGYVQLSA